MKKERDKERERKIEGGREKEREIKEREIRERGRLEKQGDKWREGGEMDEERERGEMDRDRESVKGRGIERERLKGRGIERKRRFSFNYSKNLSNGEIKHKQRPDTKYHQKALHENLIPENNLTQK